MKHIIVIISFIFLLISCNNTDNNFIQLSHHFEQDETQYFEIVKRTYDDTAFKSYHTNTILKVTQTNINQDSISYTFTYGKTYLKNCKKDIEYPEEKKWVKGSYDNQIVEINYLIEDRSISLKNYTNCKSFVRDLYKRTILNNLDSLSEEHNLTISNIINPIINDEEKLINTYFPEVVLFFKYMNMQYNIDSVYNLQGYTESHFKQGGIQGDIKISFQRSANNLTIIEKNAISGNEFSKLLSYNTDSLIHKINGSIQKESTFQKAIYYDEFNSNYDIERHLFTKIEHLRSIYIDDEQRFKMISLRLVE